jgi:YVTN family beta-propeller protein
MARMLNRRSLLRLAGVLLVALFALVFASPAFAAVTNGNPAVTAAGQSPQGLAYSPDGTHLYVANYAGGTVSDIDPATGLVVASITTTGTHPGSVTFTPDGNFAYVSSRPDGIVSVIDVSTASEVDTITGLNDPTDVAITPDGLSLYVSQYSNDTVKVFDISGSSPVVATTIGVAQGPMSIAISSFGDKVYVANYLASTISVIDGSTNNVVSSIGTATNPWDIAISPDGSWLAVSHETSHGVYLYDLQGSGFVNIPLVSQSYGVAFSPDSSHLFATEFVPNMIAEIDLTDGNAFTAHTLVSNGSGPHSVALSPNGCQIAATGSVSNVVSYLDASPCMGPPEVPFEDFPVTEKLASTGNDGVATFAWTAGAVLALLAGASILILRRRA